ncbi:MAG: hypothetical protein P4L59_19635 [Desulfosporosinus sp.]|nr:hypothetical protein [Desulfosporosinus sp.]
MKKKSVFTLSLFDHLGIPKNALDCSEFSEVYDKKANSYNAIADLLESKGFTEEELDQCMGLVKDYRDAEFDFINLLYAVNMSGGFKIYKVNKSLDDGTFKGSTLDYIQDISN